MERELILQAFLIISIGLSIIICTFYLVRLLISVKRLVDKVTLIMSDASEVTHVFADSIRSVKKSVKAGSLIAGIFSILINSDFFKQMKKKFKKNTKKTRPEPQEETAK